MRIHVQPDFGNHLSKWSLFLAYGSAFLLLVLVLVQLFRFEELVSLFTLQGGDSGLILAAVIAVSEVLAIPVLLSMYLSPLMRFVSAGSGILAMSLWIGLVLAMGQVDDTGLLGTIINVNQEESLLILSGVAILLAASYWRIFLSKQESLRNHRG